MSRDVHIIPENDLQVHILSARCWCGPRRDGDEPSVVIHNSTDGREWVEVATRAQEETNG